MLVFHLGRLEKVSALISEVSTRLKQIEDQFGTRLEKIEESTTVVDGRRRGDHLDTPDDEKIITPVIRQYKQHSEASKTTIIPEPIKQPPSVLAPTSRGLFDRIINVWLD